MTPEEKRKSPTSQKDRPVLSKTHFAEQKALREQMDHHYYIDISKVYFVLSN